MFHRLSFVSVTIMFDVVDTACCGEESHETGVVVESGNSLYQVKTVATISPHGQVSCPSVL